MRIPSESNTPYIIELTDRPLPDNNRAEAVGESARPGSALSQAPNRQPDAQGQTAPETAAAARTENVSAPERRKGERRKEQRFILLDTRAARRCRRSGRYAAVNLKI